METTYKEVYFDKYCHKCKFKATPETEDPCNECLAEPVNDHSHKPVRFEDAGD